MSAVLLLMDSARYAACGLCSAQLLGSVHTTSAECPPVFDCCFSFLHCVISVSRVIGWLMISVQMT